MPQKSPITLPLPTSQNCCSQDGCTLPQVRPVVGARYRQVGPGSMGDPRVRERRRGPTPSALLGTMPPMDMAPSSASVVGSGGGHRAARDRTGRPTRLAAIATSAIDSSSSTRASTDPCRIPADGPVFRRPRGSSVRPGHHRRHRRGHRAGARLVPGAALLDQIGPVARRGAHCQHRPTAPPPDSCRSSAGTGRLRCTTSSSTSGWAGSVTRTWPSGRCPVSSG